MLLGARSAPRVLIYSHDSYGLGHLRRCLKIAARLTESPDAPNVLIATGSPRAQSFDLPHGCDTLKLPAVTKTTGGAYLPRTLAAPLGDVVALRAELIRAAARSFRPDVVLVDHVAQGLEGELLPMLEDVSARPDRPRLVLGLRDVIDEAGRVHSEWDRLGVWSLVTQVYDKILVYGDEVLPTTAQELGLERRLGDRISFVGYLAESHHGRAIKRTTEPTIVVTAGGGGDGQGVLRSYCEFLEDLPRRAPFKSIVLTGPLLSTRREAELGRRFAAVDQPLEVLSFTNDVERLLARASGVISMAGYNTVVELLSARRPGLLIPRSRPRLEQLIRAQRLARVTELDFCAPGGPTTESISSFVEQALDRRDPHHPGVRLDGLDRTAGVLAELTGGLSCASSRRHADARAS